MTDYTIKSRADAVNELGNLGKELWDGLAEDDERTICGDTYFFKKSGPRESGFLREAWLAGAEHAMNRFRIDGFTVDEIADECPHGGPCCECAGSGRAGGDFTCSACGGTGIADV